jgi:GNAT superfamily N-acetyltransferase
MESEKLGPGSPTSFGAADPPGERRVTVTRTYLHLDSLDDLRPAAAPRVPATLVPLHPCPVERWRELYARIGGPWHWHDRDAWDQGRMQQHLQRPETHVYDLMVELAPNLTISGGFLELEQHDEGDVEIVYLGLDLQVLGHGVGAWLLEQAVRTAFAMGACRVWLHTCTLDAPAALPNYLARGFSVDRIETYEATIHD